jgi:hypothetical protein
VSICKFYVLLSEQNLKEKLISRIRMQEAVNNLNIKNECEETKEERIKQKERERERERKKERKRKGMDLQ